MIAEVARVPNGTGKSTRQQSQALLKMVSSLSLSLFLARALYNCEILRKARTILGGNASSFKIFPPPPLRHLLRQGTVN